MRRVLLICHLISLVLGGLIYLLFRDSSLILFGWIEHMGANSTMEWIQQSTLPMSGSIPTWVLYSLPDGLWLFSYVCLMLYVWGNPIPRVGLFWVFILPVLAISHELLQLTNFVIGTFDILDLSFYLIATLLPFVLISKKLNLANS